MSYQVQLLTEAELDFADIYAYLYKRSPAGAANWARAFDMGVERLRMRPETCGLANESSNLRQDVRQLLFQTKQGRVYRAIFKVDGERVVILRLRGPGQRSIRETDLPDPFA